ncbi:MAG TPA: plastocyanin/azurin family copper-binding protein [Gemmatimonadaceae bacterium]|nr:plastocyanin/azurin family copper-binding protein [Gemmatimonadaceae bacterium]
MLRRIMAATTLAAALVACGGGGSDYDGGGPTGPTGPTGQNATVDATPQITFSPATVTIAAGRSVTFRFGSVPHNVFFDAASGAPADIPTPTTNASVTRTFNTAGTFTYDCHVHPGMSGTVIVQ